MPLPLTDPAWEGLAGCYGGISDVIKWLHQAYSPSGLTIQLLGDLINEVQHQGDTSSAMYAVAPHLIELAKEADIDMQIALLTTSGMIYANAEKAGNADCPDYLEDGFIDSAKRGAELLAPLLNCTNDFQEFQWAVAALSAFLGYEYFARFLGNVELFEDEIHYSLLDRTIPVDP